MNKEEKLRKLIREEIIKSLITEKFASKKITQLFKMMDGRDQKFFATTAKGRGFAWSDVEDKNVGAGANPSNDYMNIFILNDRKVNPFQTSSEYGQLDKGIIGITIGKKSMYWPKQRYSHKPGMVGNQQKSLDNYKRYSEVADRVISIALSDIPSAKEKQAARAEAQKGATALMQARDVANANHKRYKKALTMKVAATGAEGMEKLMAQAAKVVQQVIDKNTQMLKKGKYQTSWDTYKTVTDRYSRMVDSYVRYKQEFAAAEKEKAAMKGKDVDTSWRNDYVANYMKEIKDYYTDMLQKAKIVNQGEYRDIVKEGLNEAREFVVIDPRGNAKPVGSKVQASQYIKKMGGPRKGYHLVLKKNATKARRAIEKNGGNASSTKVQDIMFDLLYEKKGKPGMWANIHAKRKRGEAPAKPGDPDRPDAKSWKDNTDESVIKETTAKQTLTNAVNALMKTIGGKKLDNRYVKDYLKSMENMARKKPMDFVKDYGDFDNSDWLEDVRYNLQNK